jgi:hypothetical protein
MFLLFLFIYDRYGNSRAECKNHYYEDKGYKDDDESGSSDSSSSSDDDDEPKKKGLITFIFLYFFSPIDCVKILRDYYKRLFCSFTFILILF